MAPHGIITGGGIAGLTAAIAFNRHKIPVKIYEAAPQIKPVGAGIWMAPNAMQVFHRLGIAGKVEAGGVPLQKIQVVDERMKVILDTRQENIRKKFGYTTTAIKRSKLQEILISELDTDQLLLNKCCAQIAENDNHITVNFKDGTSAEGDFLIGADGIHSVIRHNYFQSDNLRKHGVICWRGLADLQLKPAFKKAIIESWAFGLRFGFSEVEDGKVDWFAVKHHDGEHPHDAEALKKMLLNIFGSFSYPIPDIISATGPDTIITTELMDIDRIPRWDKGRVCLIGDAAHASTPYMGQGGCQAVEDAYALALCMAGEKDVVKAFARLQQLRKSRAEFIVSNSRVMGRIGYFTGWMAGFRNAVIRLAPVAITEQQFCKVYKLNY